MLGLLITATKSLRLLNWYLEEYEVPRRRIKRHAQKPLHHVQVDAYLTKEEMEELEKMGAVDTLNRGRKTRVLAGGD